MTVNKINLNSDFAERNIEFFQTVDMPLMANINSANISCLYHGGLEKVVQKAVSVCRKNNISIGAHVSFLDRENFGRVELDWTEHSIKTLIQDQIKFLNKICKSQNISITHLKPHGALNNMACKDPILAKVIVTYLKNNFPELIILAPALSELAKASQKIGLKTALEIFADRTYEDDGTLTSRSKKNSLITNPKEVANHLRNMFEKKAIITRTGKVLPTLFDSVCLHSDTPNSVQISNEICSLLKSMGMKQKKLTDLF